MLAPDVSNLLPTKSFDAIGLDEAKTLKILKKLHFSHSVTMLLPDTLNPPKSLTEIFSNDSDYYMVKDVPAYELVNPQFLDLFIVNGNLTLQSVNSRVDLDDCVSINSEGILSLLLDSGNFYSLGLDGDKSYFDKDRFVVRLDLKSKNFSAGSKFHLRVAERLSALPGLKFDVIVAWKPSETNVCPSSIASWFSQSGYKISTCSIKSERKNFYNVELPVYDENKLEELMEWAGMLLLDCDLAPNQPALSSYCPPSHKVALGQVVSLQWSGLLPPSIIENAYKHLKNWTDGFSSQWCFMVVHGFEDSITSIGKEQHGFFVEGDYNLTIFLPPNEPCKSVTHVSSWKKPKK